VVRLSRLRRGEIIATLSAAVLVVLVFAVPWFSFDAAGRHTQANAWTSLPTLRWLILVCAALGLLLGYLQATRSAPALPVALDQALFPLSAITTIALLIRLLTGAGSPLVGGFAGLVASAALAAGVFMSLREEQGWTPGPDHPVETVKLTGAGEPR
jgi:H+/Cl- antiporter ClcA